MCKEGIILLEEIQMHNGSDRIQTDDLDISISYRDSFQYAVPLRGNFPALYISQDR